ncbi:Probable transaldolase [Seminavis robusta]|uniref:Probable transaldolase n=1 Tax=Seminavis robusta TaxID=568900 RepID=A0A9N8DF61_9STRA|nr:Probable transaldolase [Seminavis robusta]|eukprot:Sro111_g055450.1 Probable transaldolase (270) ;mRNA; f:113847-114656
MTLRRSLSPAMILQLWILVVLSTVVESLLQSPTTSHRGHNRLFLDTAEESIWQELLPLGIFHGVTTNPSLLEAAGQECSTSNIHHLAQTALSTPGCHEVMVQAWGNAAPEMYKIGMELSKPDRARIVVSVPVTREGTKAAACLIQSGVRVCMTACFNANQAIIAAGLGAEYVAPFLGRMTDSGKSGLEECLRMGHIVNGMQATTRILVSSIRSEDSMAELMAVGEMDTFTITPDVARALFQDPLTQEAAEDFQAAAQRAGKDRLLPPTE